MKTLAFVVFVPFSTGLSSMIGRTAPVSVVFLCPQSGTPHLSGVGVVGGNTTPAKAGNTVTGLITRENPGTGFWCSSQIDKMSAKKTNGSTRCVHYSLEDNAHVKSNFSEHAVSIKKEAQKLKKEAQKLRAFIVFTRMMTAVLLSAEHSVIEIKNGGRK